MNHDEIQAARERVENATPGVWGTAGAGMLNDTFVRLRELRGEKSE